MINNKIKENKLDIRNLYEVTINHSISPRKIVADSLQDVLEAITDELNLAESTLHITGIVEVSNAITILEKK